MPKDSAQELRLALARYVGLGELSPGIDFLWKVVEQVAPAAFEIWSNTGNGVIQVEIVEKHMRKVRWEQSRMF